MAYEVNHHKGLFIESVHVPNGGGDMTWDALDYGCSDPSRFEITFEASSRKLGVEATLIERRYDDDDETDDGFYQTRATVYDSLQDFIREIREKVNRSYLTLGWNENPYLTLCNALRQYFRNTSTTTAFALGRAFRDCYYYHEGIFEHSQPEDYDRATFSSDGWED